MIETLYALLKPLYVVTSFQTGFFGMFIFTTSAKKDYHHWLSALLFTLCGTLTFFTIKWHYGIIVDALLFKFLTVVFEYAISPLFFIFIVKATQQKIQYNAKSLFLLFPFIIGLVFLFLPQYLWDTYGMQFHTFLGINFYSYSTIFFVLAYRRYKNYQVEIKNHVTQNYLLEVNVIRLMLKTFIFLLVLGFLGNIIRILFDYKLTIMNPVLEFITLSSVNIFLFLGLKLPVELSGINVGDDAYKNISEVKERYKNSSLSKEYKKDISENLDRLLFDQKYYQTPNLTINHLSQKLDIPSKFLSQVINEIHNQNFCDYINTLRIEEAKSLLKDKEMDYKTILEVCYKVGFNSKSTFNAVFKKQVGLTPTAFRKGVNS